MEKTYIFKMLYAVVPICGNKKSEFIKLSLRYRICYDKFG